MSVKSANSMTRYELEQRYKEYGCNNFKLRTLDDLKNIHGFDVMELSGYDGLPQEQRELFDKTIIKFYNTRGLDRRNRLQPKNVNFVYEKDYAMPTNVDGEYLVVGTEVFVIKKDGTLGKRLHRHIPFFRKDGKFDYGKFFVEFAEAELTAELMRQAGEWKSCVDWDKVY